ncbi:hypothetical protein Y032_0222g2610 [Ancylostoma ceylanicum]|uniref:Uncharacterized protein n=1 Tax=Ancylostoma ceylanicum TaxID=53326 RepID=A0A016SIN7_9BILA|nr:hypothetical protein Y032_0222g2610 [Ancylostoma ceylanicum]
MTINLGRRRNPFGEQVRDILRDILHPPGNYPRPGMVGKSSFAHLQGCLREETRLLICVGSMILRIRLISSHPRPRRGCSGRGMHTAPEHRNLSGAREGLIVSSSIHEITALLRTMTSVCSQNYTNLTHSLFFCFR